MRKLEEKYRSKSVEFLGVSLDDEKEAWKKDISTKKMEWPQVSDLKRWNSLAVKTYGIRSLPTYVVIDSNAIVHCKTIDFNEVVTLLDSLTRKK